MTTMTGVQETRRARSPDPVSSRLRRIEGQVTGIRRMREDGRYCIDILDQIAAARAGLESVAQLVLEGHLQSCVRRAADEGQGEEIVAEMMQAMRRYARGR